MRLFLSVRQDGVIKFRSSMEYPYGGTLILRSPKGKDFCGLTYEEATRYAWIDTDDVGNFVRGEKRLPPNPNAEPFDLPPFVLEQEIPW
jgi:hypothetical protein